jgi:hypothetical protein
LLLQLHDGFKKLHVRPSIELSPEDFDEFAGNGCDRKETSLDREEAKALNHVERDDK